MINVAKTMKDDDERNAFVREIVRMMGCIAPHVKESPDHEKYLWEAAYIMADFDLDVKSPYPPPSRDAIMARPTQRPPYYKGASRFRQYGRNVEEMLKKAIAMEDLDERKALVTMTANFMKIQLKNGDKDSVAEASVLEHIRVITAGKLTYQPGDINFHRAAVQPPLAQTATPSKAKKKKKKKKRNR